MLNDIKVTLGDGTYLSGDDATVFHLFVNSMHIAIWRPDEDDRYNCIFYRTSKFVVGNNVGDLQIVTQEEWDANCPHLKILAVDYTDVLGWSHTIIDKIVDDRIDA